MGVVAETMVALVLASEALRKFGGDSVAEFRRNRDGYLGDARRDALPRPAAGRPMADRLVLVGMMGAGKTTVGRHAAPSRLGWGYLDSDAQVVGGEPAARSPSSSRRRASGVPRRTRRGCWHEALSRRRPGGGLRGRRGGARSGPTERCSPVVATVVWLRARRRHPRRPGGRRGGAPAPRRRPGRPRSRHSTRCAVPSTRGRARGGGRRRAHSPRKWWSG